eukprot:184743-Rhodomonas_salina.1
MPVQVVPGMQFHVFDFGVYPLEGSLVCSRTQRQFPPYVIGSSAIHYGCTVSMLSLIPLCAMPASAIA